MKHFNSNQKIKSGKIIIIILSAIGIIACIPLLFSQVRLMIMDFVIQIMHKENPVYSPEWLVSLLTYAIVGICFILFFDYCSLTNSGRRLVQNTKQELKDCLSEIDFRSLRNPVLIMLCVYFLGVLTIIRAHFLYQDDIWWSISGIRGWYDWSRYIVVFLSYFVQPEIRMTYISPLPLLLAILILACSSVLLVYILGKGKITIVRLLASIPMGLSPFFLECLSYNFSSPYMALPIMVSIVPFLFITRKKAFIFVSVVSLLIMCMTYQAASGIYPMIAAILCFQYWNSREKNNKEIFSFLGMTAITFCFSMLFFRFFLMRPFGIEYASTAAHSVTHLISGTLSNIINYTMTIYQDFSIIWIIGIAIVLFFFIIKSVYKSAQKRIFSFFISILVIILSFMLSFGVFSLLAAPIFSPRALMGFGVFLAILCVYVVSDYIKIASFAVLALNWCLFVFAFSYGNALADQARYAEFRVTILLHDLIILYPNENNEDRFIKFQNSIEYTPSVKNIEKHYPIIGRLVPKRLSHDLWDYTYFLNHFNFLQFAESSFLNRKTVFNSWDELPVVFDSYYHTIKSDGEHILIVLKH